MIDKKYKAPWDTLKTKSERYLKTILTQSTIISLLLISNKTGYIDFFCEHRYISYSSSNFILNLCLFIYFGTFLNSVYTLSCNHRYTNYDLVNFRVTTILMSILSILLIIIYIKN